jgi:filamentous hemagglutinin family protein
MWNTKYSNKIAGINYSKLILYGAVSAVVLITPKIGRSQIVPDNTLPNNTITLPNGNVVEINGGTTNGNNLFHSFEQFSIPADTTAIFNNAATIENIFSRVTGGNISNIEGLIEANGTANLFLLNPAGIIFGENATLNIGGSLFVSTANSLIFSDGSQFSAVNPEAPPLLTVSIPVGLQYGENPGTITVRGNGHNLFGDPETFSTNRDNRPPGIAVTPQKTLALLGGEINLEGGNVTAQAGNIEVWAVTDNSQLSIVDSNGTFTIEPSNTAINYTDINLSQAASIDVSGDRAGGVRVRGRNITLTEGSVILSETLGNGEGGLLQVNASESITVDGTTPDFGYGSGLVAEIVPGAIGQGSDLLVNTKNLIVSGGAFISSGTFGAGHSGSITVNAESIELIDGATFGDIFISPSGIFSQAIFSGTGSSGDININTKTLSLTGGAKVSTVTGLGGDSGSIFVNAETISIRGTAIDGFPSGFDTTTFAGEGNAGDIEVNTARLLTTDGGQITTATFGEGNAGNLTINATESVELKGATAQGRTGLFASAFRGTGDGGNLNVNTKQLTVEDGATISVSNFQSRNLAPPGQGAPGNLNITAEQLSLNEGIITAEANSGSKGNISIVANNIVLQDNSLLTTNAQGEATGGNITIETDTLTALDNSDITANAVDNFAGRVNITATGIFGTEFRQQQTSQSDITASSALGAEFSGVVQLNTPDVDPASGLSQLPKNVIDPTSVVAAKCPASQLGNTFVVTGQGGLPDNPGNSLRGTSVWHDLRPIATEQSETNSNISPPKQHIRSTTPIIEAKGWQVNERGQIILTADASKVVPSEAIFPYLQCQE